VADLLAELRARSPRRLLEELAELGRALAKADRPRPELELQLASGQGVRGRIVTVDDERDGPIAVLHVGGRPDAPSVAFVRIEHVAAVTVVDASLLVRAPVVEAPVPSRLELARKLTAQAETLAGKAGRAVRFEIAGELDDDGRRAVAAVLPVAAEVLSSIHNDELGRQALAAIETIELAAGPQGEVTRHSGVLRIVAPMLLVEAFTARTLRDAIEKLL
jgi:hypothetical protein